MNPDTNTTPQTHQPPLTQQPTLPQVTTISPEPKVAENSKKPSLFRSFMSTTLLIVGALLFALFLNQFVFQSYEVDGSSMEPTLQNRDRLIVWKLPRSWSRVTGNPYLPSRGDIVVFHKPDGTDEQLIKRVIGLPGERVVVKDEKITVFNSEYPNGFNPDDAEYGKKLEPTYGNADVIVGENEIFVSGDNRVPGASLDSRSSLGNVPLENIVGTLAVRIYPF